MEELIYYEVLEVIDDESFVSTFEKIEDAEHYEKQSPYDCEIYLVKSQYVKIK